MGEINALSCVGQDDVVSLRIVCTMARDGRQHNLEDVDMYGNTALLKACYLGRFECARTLLEFGANIFAMNYFGQNALTLATYAGHLTLVKELLRRRSYKDFNLSSMIPALCVATLQKHSALVAYFTQLDPRGVQETQTVHGLGVAELRGMIKAAGRLDKRNARSPPTFITNRLR
ncbi:DNA replication inhibitor plutonium [Drosophila simulans]|uniref:Plu protein n=2 Tax=melanogaster subgroup TaxID=32351 RepID=Q5R289_DROSI|nr:DNA replication inhibitor plutonium [Drosophila simulans]XP_033151457.1 DNA replication inhibitor plutonium [Drosophila mauritiana]EDX07886.1 plutonium [Drosophila simulans]KMY95232.1 plutonium [Drosophila simulans]BAD72903.1 plu [Drosophila simulans]